MSDHGRAAVADLPMGLSATWALNGHSSGVEKGETKATLSGVTDIALHRARSVTPSGVG
ncbi:MAG: hypothetical protein RJS97_23450 [Parvibaculaceae bacterium]